MLQTKKIVLVFKYLLEVSMGRLFSSSRLYLWLRIWSQKQVIGSQKQVIGSITANIHLYTKFPCEIRFPAAFSALKQNKTSIELFYHGELQHIFPFLTCSILFIYSFLFSVIQCRPHEIFNTVRAKWFFFQINLSYQTWIKFFCLHITQCAINKASVPFIFSIQSSGILW